MGIHEEYDGMEFPFLLLKNGKTTVSEINLVPGTLRGLLDIVVDWMIETGAQKLLIIIQSYRKPNHSSCVFFLINKHYWDFVTMDFLNLEHSYLKYRMVTSTETYIYYFLEIDVTPHKNGMNKSPYRFSLFNNFLANLFTLQQVLYFLFNSFNLSWWVLPPISTPNSFNCSVSTFKDPLTVWYILGVECMVQCIIAQQMPRKEMEKKMTWR